MALCSYCCNIHLPLLWASKRPQVHQPSLLALTVSAEDCPSCAILLGAVPDWSHRIFSMPTLLTRAMPLMLVTANGYKYNKTITDHPIKIDCLGVYIDGQEDEKDQQNLGCKVTKANPKYFCSWLDVYATQDSLAASSGIVGRVVPPIANFELPHQWLTECRTNHSLCSNQSSFNPSTVPIYPAYLVDVIWQRLVEFASIEPSSEYLTLSHRWHRDMITTTKRSLTMHLKQLPIESLSQCFKDALNITRLCGFRYIWIDALCIIQDSVTHVLKECSRMKDIYHQCCIMLAANSIEDKTTSLYPSRPEFQEAELPFQAWSASLSSQWTMSNRNLGHFSSDVVHGILSSRGWTLQERVLAPRILHFGKHQLYWECRASIWNEKTDYKLPYHDTPALDDVRDIKSSVGCSDLSHSSRLTSGMSKGVTKYTQWYDIVSAYSCRHLSYLEDKLSAIQGIADLFQARVHDKYIWGLWRHDIPAGLLWSVQATNPAKFLSAPSWSWASIHGELTFHIPSTKWGRPLQGRLQVTCDDMDLADYSSDSYRLPKGKISCCCPIQKVALSNEIAIKEDNDYPFDHLNKQPNAAVFHPTSCHYIGYAIMDDEMAITRYITEKILLYAVMLYQAHSELNSPSQESQKQRTTRSYCILLEPSGSSDHFRRRGYAEIQVGAFAEAEERTISII